MIRFQSLLLKKSKVQGPVPTFDEDPVELLSKYIESGATCFQVVFEGGGVEIVRVLAAGRGWLLVQTDRSAQPKVITMEGITSFKDVTGNDTYEPKLPKKLPEGEW